MNVITDYEFIELMGCCPVPPQEPFTGESRDNPNIPGDPEGSTDAQWGTRQHLQHDKDR